MMNDSMFYEPNGVFVLLAFLPVILSLVIIGFGIYFVIRIIKFMNAKTKLDQERNEKLDELIKIISQDKGME